jgi:hypothetical protein
MRTSRSLLLTLLLGALVCVVSTASAANSSPDACRVGTKRAVIGGKVKCLKAGQVCQARYQAAYKRYGFTCVKGHLRKRTTPPTPQPPAPPPVPPTPPPPPAQPGHYHGTTSQLEVIDFDVTSSGRTVTNVSTGQINEGCTPPGSLSGGNYKSGGAVIPISADGTFTIDFDYRSTVGDSPATGHFTLIGHFTGTNTATGTLEDKTSFTYNGVGYSCGSGQQSWTASRTS